MTEEKANHISYMYYDCVPALQRIQFAEKLKGADDALYDEILKIRPKNPSTVKLLSIFLGFFGVDRFYIGDYLLGALKLLTTLLFPIIMCIITLTRSESAAPSSQLYIMPIILCWVLAMNIWWIVDIVVCRRRANAKTFRKIMGLLG